MHLVTANAYERVLEIATPQGVTATAFTINDGGEQYIITARHLFPKGAQRFTATVANRHGEHDLDLDFVPGLPTDADVALARLTNPLTPDLPLPPTMDGLSFSQRVFFLGFPYGMALEAGAPAERIAFVKGATLSATATVKGVRLVYLDGINNIGFSGGPVVGANPDTGQLQVIAVVAGFRTERQPVLLGTQPHPAIATDQNTGIIVATNINHAVEAVRAV